MINEIDQKIVEILLRDARITHAQIAETVGLSRPAVAERIRKLEQAGIIEGYTAIVSPEAMGRSITAFISARYMGILDDTVRRGLNDLAKQEEILEMHSVAGEDCFLIKVRTIGMQELNQVVNRLKAPPFEMVTKTTIVLERYFEKVGGVTLAS
ncbi:MAG: Lrp/AsnC family transcriptional regulator [bacterium]